MENQEDRLHFKMKVKNIFLIFLFGLLLLGSLNFGKADLMDGLTHFYSMNETSGTAVYDQAGATDLLNNGALVGQTGLVSTSYYFNGIAYLSGIPLSIFSNSFSISMRVNATTSNEAASYIGTDPGTGSNGFVFGYGSVACSSTQFGMSFLGAGVSSICATQDITQNQWYTPVIL